MLFNQILAAALSMTVVIISQTTKVTAAPHKSLPDAYMFCYLVDDLVCITDNGDGTVSISPNDSSVNPPQIFDSLPATNNDNTFQQLQMSWYDNYKKDNAGCITYNESDNKLYSGLCDKVNDNNLFTFTFEQDEKPLKVYLKNGNKCLYPGEGDDHSVYAGDCSVHDFDWIPYKLQA
eukprot:Pgem_evm1s1338